MAMMTATSLNVITGSNGVGTVSNFYPAKMAAMVANVNIFDVPHTPRVDRSRIDYLLSDKITHIIRQGRLVEIRREGANTGVLYSFSIGWFKRLWVIVYDFKVSEVSVHRCLSGRTETIPDEMLEFVDLNDAWKERFIKNVKSNSSHPAYWHNRLGL